ncbi:MAG: hypothetical protein A3B29_00140 [Candidatus Sungbacteria bacterium RIFCSPLOWO2_01_FULL_51_34]|uniref:Uncharacterized protein n=1 Tax=Candidatus Sungbacteria bacterium RIFCSPHIGHO2_02_FULL_51_29 TaxID=1802273 RepID=A0A1G2KW28_9BACT|nr:MAG: hypothetical protein A3C16_05655 [Candidatus Sungbacteria bacterium RIFCSPHIGHO2_02_FULL_51_29]OHA05254.1 MAG: hypothetical protein A3B29_00140 [Candidatus Sungbacteria bacterium RIFCSPLOWO2_01_FULL_51_34]
MLAKIRERGRHHFSNPRGNQKSFFVNNRFELAIAFLKEANRAEKYAQQENPERIRDFLKKIGSNFRIAERTLSFPLKNAWILAEKYHAEALCAEATSFNFAECKTWRRRKDSNLRCGFPHNILAGCSFVFASLMRKNPGRHISSKR